MIINGWWDIVNKGISPVTIYTLEDCPNCEQLKDYLQEKGIAYAEEDMASAEPLTELRLHGVFVREAPVLRIGERFLTSPDLFKNGKIRADSLTGILSGDPL
ncbi:MAG: glutaredoxin family protein [Methanomicrobiales archaeon]|nr:glutaredoxin family protein [Methanomicrobiales archaeon]